MAKDLKLKITKFLGLIHTFLEVEGETLAGGLLPPSPHAHSKQLFTGNLYDACAKASDIVLIKIMTSPGVEIRIAFLICYLQSLYEIELGHYFCPEFAGHVTNQNILVDAGKLM